MITDERGGRENTMQRARQVHEVGARFLVHLLLGILLVALTASSALAAPPAQASDDQAISGGWHYRQTSGVAGQGFDLRDWPTTPAGPAPFWTQVESMGGVAVLGYPVTRAFLGRDGCIYQLLQRVTLQACPGFGVRFANTFQILEEADQDGFLDAVRSIPQGQPDFARSFDEAVAIRLGWLEDPALREEYFRPPGGHTGPWTVLDAINLYGLPMSRPENRGPFIVQRFQRIALQRWTVDHPLGIFPAGTVVQVLGGDLLKETGVVSGQLIQPHGAGESALQSLPVVSSFPPVAGQAPAATAVPPTATAIPATPIPQPTATPVPAAPIPQPTATLATGRAYRLEYGFQAHMLDSRFDRRANAINWTKEAGFGWLKQQVLWSTIEKQAGVYDPQELSYLDGTVNEASAAGLKVFLSVVKSPDFYAVPGGHSPSDPTKLGDFLRFLASRYQGKVQAFETWNEQNLSGEWGAGRLCQNWPAEFLALQRAAFNGVKAGNASAVVVFPALTPTGHGDCNAAIDDVVYLDRLYRDTGGEISKYFDVLGVHPSGFNSPPGDWTDRTTAEGSGFRNHPSFFFLRFTQLRDVMLKHGDDRPMWFTEFGWSVCPTVVVPNYDYCRDNSEEERAQYFRDAFQMLQTQYPYVQTAIVWNLNFRDIVPETDEKWGFGLVNTDGSKTPAYEVLKALPK